VLLSAGFALFCGCQPKPSEKGVLHLWGLSVVKMLLAAFFMIISRCEPQGEGQGQLRWQSVNFTYTSPLICPLTRETMDGGRGGQQAGPPVIICHYKTTQQKGENPIISWAKEG